MFLTASLVAIACQQKPPVPSSLAVTRVELPDCFDLYTELFTADSVSIDTQRVRVDIKEAGDLEIISGKLIVGDPVILKDLQPYAIVLPKGHFPIEVLRLRFLEYDLNALVRLAFSNAAPVKWKVGTSDRATMDTASVHSEDFIGFGVDAASAIAFDLSNQQTLQDAEFDRLWTDNVHASGEFVAFSTGGDGHFPVYFGFDEKGDVCQLIVDLLKVPCSCL